MFSLLWNYISLCEKSSLKVNAITCDGGSSNRNLFQMQCPSTQYDNMKPEVDVTYCMRNLFTGTKKRFLYSISHVLHLLKTVGNCLPISGSGKFRHYMWNS